MFHLSYACHYKLRISTPFLKLISLLLITLLSYIKYVWKVSIQERFLIKSWLIGYNGKVCGCRQFVLEVNNLYDLGFSLHCLPIFVCTHEVSFKITHWSFKVLITNICPRKEK